MAMVGGEKEIVSPIIRIQDPDLYGKELFLPFSKAGEEVFLPAGVCSGTCRDLRTRLLLLLGTGGKGLSPMSKRGDLPPLCCPSVLLCYDGCLCWRRRPSFRLFLSASFFRIMVLQEEKAHESHSSLARIAAIAATNIRSGLTFWTSIALSSAYAGHIFNWAVSSGSPQWWQSRMRSLPMRHKYVAKQSCISICVA